jgi:hypothetical protein
MDPTNFSAAGYSSGCIPEWYDLENGRQISLQSRQVIDLEQECSKFVKKANENYAANYNDLFKITNTSDYLEAMVLTSALQIRLNEQTQVIENENVRLAGLRSLFPKVETKVTKIIRNTQNASEITQRQSNEEQPLIAPTPSIEFGRNSPRIPKTPTRLSVEEEFFVTPNLPIVVSNPFNRNETINIQNEAQYKKIQPVIFRYFNALEHSRKGITDFSNRIGSFFDSPEAFKAYRDGLIARQQSLKIVRRIERGESKAMF